MLLPKTAAAASKLTAPTVLPPGLIIAIIMALLHTVGPMVLPMVEAWLATLNLPPAVLAAIDAAIEAFLKSQPATP